MWQLNLKVLVIWRHITKYDLIYRPPNLFVKIQMTSLPALKIGRELKILDVNYGRSLVLQLYQQEFEPRTWKMKSEIILIFDWSWYIATHTSIKISKFNVLDLILLRSVNKSRLLSIVALQVIFQSSTLFLFWFLRYEIRFVVFEPQIFSPPIKPQKSILISLNISTVFIGSFGLNFCLKVTKTKKWKVFQNYDLEIECLDVQKFCKTRSLSQDYQNVQP
jgi:hypothetical protein